MMKEVLALDVPIAGSSAAVRSGIDRVNEVRVIQRASVRALAKELRPSPADPDSFGREDLERDSLLESNVARLEDGPHAADADAAHDLVIADLRIPERQAERIAQAPHLLARQAPLLDEDLVDRLVEPQRLVAVRLGEGLGEAVLRDPAACMGELRRSTSAAFNGLSARERSEGRSLHLVSR
jgi:hypothetical protein